MNASRRRYPSSFKSLGLAVITLVMASAFAFACTSHKPDPLTAAAPSLSPSSWGLDTRPVPTSCLYVPSTGVGTANNPAPAPPTAQASFAFAPVSTRTFNNLIEVDARSTDRVYVAEQGGVLSYLVNAIQANTVLDIQSRVTNGYDQGLLGFAFHPKFPAKPYVYITYTAPYPTTPAPANIPFQAVIARFETTDGGLTFDPASEKRLLVFDHPGVNHNNDSVVFGPDGYLYIASGSSSDPDDLTYQNAQIKTQLLGKILRIDVDGGDPYVVPPSNPFANATDGTRPEIYAYGLRNPWRFNFDDKSGRLWAGDVGNLRWEEIDEITPGGNYGWGNREGFECNVGGATCDGSYIDPLVVHGHDEAAAIVGGVFYYGTALPALTGKYVYSDAQSSNFWAITTDGTPKTPVRLDEGLPRVRPVSMRLDAKGEILVVSYLGTLFRMVPPPATTATSEQPELATTGCVDPTDSRIVAPGLFHYGVNVNQYSDGLDSDRWLAIPPNTQIMVDPDTHHLALPPESVAIKTLSTGGKNIETQLLLQSSAGNWVGETYVWTADGTKALLASTEVDLTLPSGRIHHIDPTTCTTRCHAVQIGTTLGLEAAQLDHEGVDYGNGRLGNPLATLEHIGMIATPVDRSSYRPLAAIDGSDLIETRARSYLHANCSFCHGYLEPDDTTTGIDLLFTTPLAKTRTCNISPPNRAIYFVPGNPDASLLVQSLKSLDPSRSPLPMPPKSSSVDDVGVNLVSEWIRGVAMCP